MTVLIIICMIACWILYHKTFNVVYFNLGRALVAELIGCFFVGGILAILIQNFWYIVVPILVVVVGLVALGKSKK